LLAQASLKSKYQNLVVAQTFIKEKYRVDLLKKIPETKFILVETNKTIREKRLIERVDYPLDLEYARKMENNFEKPIVDHLVIVNDEDGEESIKKQLYKHVFIKNNSVDLYEIE